MKLSLEGRCAVVTGGTRGIGQAIAATLAEAGALVEVFDRTQPAEPGPGQLRFHLVDITDAAAVQAAIDAIASPISLLVNNAGITRDRSLTKMSDAEWADVLAVNLTGAFNMIRAAVPAMAGAKGCSIVNVTSINGLRGKFGQANYTASKAGLIGLTKTAARELGRKGITVNAVAPGMVMTDMARDLPREILEQALQETVLGRLTEPSDVAAAVLFLASDAARSITGQVLQVDAGQLM